MLLRLIRFPVQGARRETVRSYKARCTPNEKANDICCSGASGTSQEVCDIGQIMITRREVA